MNDVVPRLYLCNRQLGTGSTDQFMVFNAKMDKKELGRTNILGMEGASLLLFIIGLSSFEVLPSSTSTIITFLLVKSDCA